MSEPAADRPTLGTDSSMISPLVQTIGDSLLYWAQSKLWRQISLISRRNGHPQYSNKSREKPEVDRADRKGSQTETVSRVTTSDIYFLFKAFNVL